MKRPNIFNIFFLATKEKLDFEEFASMLFSTYHPDETIKDDTFGITMTLVRMRYGKEIGKILS